MNDPLVRAGLAGLVTIGLVVLWWVIFKYVSRKWFLDNPGKAKTIGFFMFFFVSLLIFHFAGNWIIELFRTGNSK